MNLDRTFCSGLRCTRANTCDRWIVHLEKFIKENPRFEGRTISMAQFADHDGKCDMYSPIENVPDTTSRQGEEKA